MLSSVKSLLGKHEALRLDLKAKYMERVAWGAQGACL